MGGSYRAAAFVIPCQMVEISQKRSETIVYRFRLKEHPPSFVKVVQWYRLTLTFGQAMLGKHCLIAEWSAS